MGTENSLNAINLLRRELERNLRPVLVDKIISNMVAEFTEKIKPIVVKEVKKVSLASLEQFSDIMKMRDELRLVIKIVEDE